MRELTTRALREILGGIAVTDYPASSETVIPYLEALKEHEPEDPKTQMKAWLKKDPGLRFYAEKYLSDLKKSAETDYRDRVTLNLLSGVMEEEKRRGIFGRLFGKKNK